MGAVDVKTGFIVELCPEEEKTAIAKAFSYTDKEIADMKCVSINTIKSQKQSIFLKLGVRNSTELAMLVYQRLTGVVLNAKDFISENRNHTVAIILLCIYLGGHWSCDLRRPRRIQVRRQDTELIIEEI